MQLGRVVREVWLERACPSFKGGRLVAVVVRRADGSDGAEVVALDTLDAQAGQQVLVGTSSRVRDLVAGPGVPTKAVIVAIVDEVLRAAPEPRDGKLRLAGGCRR